MTWTLAAALLLTVQPPSSKTDGRPPQCSAALIRKQQSISYAPRTAGIVLEELNRELAGLSSMSAFNAPPPALGGYQLAAPTIEQRAAVAAALGAALQSGRELVTHLTAGDAAASSAALASHLAARADYFALLSAQVRARRVLPSQMPPQQGGPKTPAARLRQLQEVHRAGWARDDAFEKLRLLQEAEYASRLRLDVLPPGAPERGAVQTAYYEAIVGQMAAQKAYEDAWFVYAREHNVNAPLMAYSLTRMNCDS